MERLRGYFFTVTLVLIALLVMIGGDAGTATTTSAQSAIVGRYVVVLKPDAGSTLASILSMGQQQGLVIDYVYPSALKGFAARLTANQAASLAGNPLVEFVSLDRQFSISSQVVPLGVDRVD